VMVRPQSLQGLLVAIKVPIVSPPNNKDNPDLETKWTVVYRSLSIMKGRRSGILGPCWHATVNDIL